MAPPNKPVLSGLFSTPEQDLAKLKDVKPKQRDKSRSSPPAPVALPSKPTAKTLNPDLGAQQPRGAELPPLQANPIAPPVPGLQRFGVNMDINQVNDHIERIANAYSSVAGHTPGAGLVFDLLKSNNLLTQDGKVDINYEDLFGIAHSRREAMAMQVARAADSDPLATAPVVYLTPKDIIKGITAAMKEDSKHASWANAGNTPYFSAWMKENSESVQDAWSHPDTRKALIVGLDPITSFRPAAYLREGLVPDPRGVGFVLKGIGQIVQSTADMPYGAYLLGRAITLDTYDSLMLLRNEVRGRVGMSTEKGIHMPNHSWEMLKQMAHQVLQDVEHPKQNAGYLTMDIWAAFTIGAGVTSRAGAVARAEGVAAKARAIVTKAPPQNTFYAWNNPETGLVAYGATIPLSDTAAVAVLQKHFPVVGRVDRAARLEAEMTHGYDAVTGRQLINELLPTSKSIARQMRRDEKLQMAVALTPVTEMVRMLKAQSWGAGIRDVVEGNRRFSLARLKGAASRQSLAIDAMLRIYFLDDPDPYNTWRGIHERMIQQADQARTTLRDDSANAAMKADETLLPEDAAKGLRTDVRFNRADRQLLATIDSHKAQLEALELGRRLWEAPPTREIQQIREYAEEVGGLREQWLHEYSGFSYEQMSQHIAELGAAVRGENVIYTGNELRPWEKGVSSYSQEETNAVQVELEKNTKALKDAETRVSKASATSRLHPGSNDEEVRAAQAAVQRHGKSLTRTQKRMKEIQSSALPLTKVKEDSRHIPMHSEKYREGGPRNRRFRSRFGVTPLDAPIQTWTGDSLKLGDFRMDTSALLAEQLHVAHKAYMHYVRHNDLWDAATTKPMTGNEVPIRDITTIPEELRHFITQMERTKLEPNFDSIINDATLDNLRKVLYPTKQEVLDGTVSVDHVRYVDENLVLDKIGRVPTDFWNTIDRFMSNTMGVVNEPMRLMLIFGTPAYALNWLGSAALGMIHDGPMAPIHYGEALMSNKAYGGEVTRLFDRIAGQTHASALVSEKNFFTKGSQALQNGWGNLTDLHWRRAMVIKELKRHGLLTGSNEEIKAALMDPANSKKISQAGDTARKAMLDFNSLTMVERAALRHVFFVYSFVRASGIWSLRFLRDHGVQSDAYAQSGKGRQENIDQMIGKMPSWFMRQGYFAIHPGLVYNPIQWNMPGMLEQIATPFYSIFGHTPYSSAAELLGPAAVMGMETLTGYDTQGQQLKGPGGNLEKSIIAQYNQTFLGQIATKHLKAAKETANPLKPEPVDSTFLNPIASAMSRERSGVNQSVFNVDGFMNTWGLAILRSALPRGVNRVAGEARYWRDLRDTNPAAYHQHELDKVTEMVKRQALVVGEPVPGNVISAVDMVSRVSQSIDDYKRAHKGEPTPNTKTITQITINSLVSQGRITDGKGWLDRLKKADTEAEVKEIRVKALYAGGADAWKLWVDKVKAIDAYANANYNVYVQGIKDVGLGDFTSSASRPQKDRWIYGRHAEKVVAKSKQLASEVGAQSGNAAKEARQQWIDYVNQNDKPTTIAGVAYPSPFAYEFATKTDAQQAKAMASWSKRKPGELTAMQTELLTGTRPAPIVVKAWETLYGWLQNAKKAAGVGHPIQSGTYATYYNHLMSKDPDVKKSFSFALLPLGKRMSTYKPIQKSQFAGDWDWLLGLANSRYDQLAKAYVNDSGKPRQNVISDQWKTNDVPALHDLVIKRNPGFLSELRLYTGATSDANADAYLSKFLGRLIAP